MARKKSKPAPAAKAQPQAGRPFPIVGVGASAGGLQAFSALLQALPVDTGLALVFVQHLEAGHASMLAKLLARATSLPVREVNKSLKVEPNHVYVNPPNADLVIRSGILEVSRRKTGAARRLPIDQFFRSLAQDRGSNAFGVILSGTASDGTLGLEAIKAEGGITFAQDEESAQFDGMPRSAIAAGCVDFVLPPEGIAKELARLVRNPLAVPPAEGQVPELAWGDRELHRIFLLLRATTGVDFSHYKKATLKRRLARRMLLRKARSLTAYVRFLADNRTEQEALYEDLLIHVTGFFREPEVFRSLQRVVIPKILSGRGKGEALRVWVPGCSSGEEAYSIAMCFLEKLGGGRAETAPLQIFATDVSDRTIETARTGKYPASALTQVSRERLRRFFAPVDGHYQISSAVREVCTFARHDLTRDPPFSRLDLISCRNVLIYMEAVLQKRVLAAFQYGLKDTGFLLLGRSEALHGHPEFFGAVDKKNKFFTRRARPSETGYPVARLEPRQPKRTLARLEAEDAPPLLDLEKEADRLVWGRYAHAGLIVNGDLQILHFRGDTNPYLSPAPGRASFNLLKIIRQELRLELQAAIQKVKRGAVTVRREGLRFSRNGDVHLVNVEVRLIGERGRQRTHYLILLEQSGKVPAEPAAPAATRRKAGKPGDEDVPLLKQELARTREYLHATIEEQETTNEELQSANEEALSSNEELQSTNEELETAKEELQSTNEELITLNEQLQIRNAELAQVGDDLSNVLSGVSIPILMLGRDGRIRRFTPAAEKLLHLLPSDVGRPLADIRLPLEVTDLERLLQKVLREGAEVEHEAKDRADHWHSIWMRPYRTREHKIDGVLIAFFGIDALKHSQGALRQEALFVSALLDTAGALIVVVDREGRIVRFNRACQEVTGYSEAEVRGRRVWDFLLIPEEVDPVKGVFQKLLTKRRPLLYENHWVAKDGRRRLIAWSDTVLAEDDQAVKWVIGTGLDITERTQAERELRESEATIRALLETASQAILAVNSEGRIVLVNSRAAQTFGYAREELLGQRQEMLVPKRFRGRHAGLTSGYFSEPRGEPLFEQDFFGLRQDGSEFPMEVNVSHFEAKDGMITVAFVTDITERKRAEVALRASETMARRNQEELRALTARVLHAQEEERKRLSRELHDDLNQRLAMLAVEVETLEQELPKSADPLRSRLRALRGHVGELSDDVRRTAYQLHPSTLEHLGLAAALKAYCADFSRTEGIQVHFEQRRLPETIPDDVALCLYRVTQESLGNVAKHSGARVAAVILAGAQGGLHLKVSDAGKGFDPVAVKGRGGLGIVGIEERVRLLAGSFSIEAQPKKGTAVDVHIPLPRSTA